MKEVFTALLLTLLAGSAVAFELQNIHAGALLGPAASGLAEVKPDRGLEDDMPHGSIPGWNNMIYDWEDNRPLVRSGELSGGQYSQKPQAEKAMRDWVNLLKLAGITPKSYGVSAVTGRPWRFTIFYEAGVRLQCAGAGAFKDYALAMNTVRAAAGKYEAAGKKVVAVMISNSYSSDTPYYTWVYFADSVGSGKSQSSMAGPDRGKQKSWPIENAAYEFSGANLLISGLADGKKVSGLADYLEVRGTVNGADCSGPSIPCVGRLRASGRDLLLDVTIDSDKDGNPEETATGIRVGSVNQGAASFSVPANPLFVQDKYSMLEHLAGCEDKEYVWLSVHVVK